MRVIPKPIKPRRVDHHLILGMYMSRYYNQPGRTVASSRDEVIHPPQTVPSGYEIDTIDLTTMKPPMDDEDEAMEKPLAVLSVDLMIDKNCKKHHTDIYDLAKEPEEGVNHREPQLIVRRGEIFVIVVKTNRPYYEDIDCVEVVMEIGEHPRVSKGTRIILHVEQGLRQRHWGIRIASQDEQELVLHIQPRPECIIGKWRLLVDTSLKMAKEGEKLVIKRHCVKQPIYMLFNPWCKEDQVYLQDNDLRDEYIINDKGKIFDGTKNQISFKPWAYSQFEEVVLDCALYLLDISRLNYKVRGNAVHVCRTICAILNSADDGGVLQGNWSGNYDAGTPPTKWNGSLGIIEEFWKTKKTVKFGQCWVFAGVITTITRVLGIPCRTVTSFASAHDCDGSVAVDVHWDNKGKPMSEYNDDSLWNFHVWNEAWMTRPDLVPGYGGWQAFDATPQETSGGIYCAGPASVRAIKEGNVNYPFEAAYIFAEVNADEVHWVMQGDKTWTKTIQKNKVGQRISTQWPRRKPKLTCSNWWEKASFDPDREDITRQYKFQEGSEEERASVYRANLYSTKPEVYDLARPDVNFEICQKDHVLVGKDFEVEFKMQNKSSHNRNVHTTITLSTVYYTGVLKAVVTTKDFDTKLTSLEGDEAMFRVVPDEYIHLITDQVGFLISVMANVVETGQVFVATEDFRLRRPDIAIMAPAIAKVGETIDVIFRLESPMPINLTQCEWTVEGAGIQKPISIPYRDLDPYDRIEITVKVTPKKTGEDREIIASFISKELSDVRGHVFIDVRDKI